MSDFEFVLEEGEADGRFVYSRPGMGEAEVTFSKSGNGVLTIDHTYVPHDYRGQGIALKLVARVVRHARDRGVKVVPECPYAATQFARHPDWADVRAS